MVTLLPLVGSLFGSAASLFDRVTQIHDFGALVDRVVDCFLDGWTLANDAEQI